MRRLSLKLALAALACTGFTATAQADGHTCADITFIDAVYERWPFADLACLEIVTRDDGNTYARFEAEVLSQTPSGTFVRYSLNDGSRTDRRKARPPEGFMAQIGGEDMAIKDLAERQKVNVYLPDSAWAQPKPVMAPAAPAAVAAPAAAAMAPEPEPEPEPAPVMPMTAGNLAWLAIIGSLLLVMGGALRLARQR